MNRTTTKITLFLAGLLSCWPPIVPHCVAQPAAENDRLARTAIAAYVANIRSFTYYQTEYILRDGKSRSVEDAIQGRFLNARDHKLRLVIDGDKELFEAPTPELPPENVKGVPIDPKKGLYAVPAPLESGKYLASGMKEMDYGPEMRVINLHSREKSTRGLAFTPLGMFFIHHGPRYRGPDILLTKKEYDFVPEGATEVDGRLVINVRFKTNKRGKSTIVYSLDPSKGYLPVRIALSSPEGYPDLPPDLVVLTDVRECSKQRWFPERILHLCGPLKDGLYSAREMRVLTLDPDKRPDPAGFAFTIPAGTSVLDYDGGDARIFYKLKQDEKISADDIPKLFSMLEQKKTTPLMDTAVPRPWLPPWARWLGGGFGLLVALGAGLFLAQRLWKKRPA